MSTGNRTRELGTDNWQYAVVYYDDLGRAVQTVKTNHLGGATRTSTNLRFNGTARDVHIEHDFGGKAESMREHYHYEYEPYTSRPAQVFHRINDGQEVLLQKNQYDQLGRLDVQHAGGANKNRTQYTYNVRSWLKSIEHGHFRQQTTQRHPNTRETSQAARQTSC